ncbi:MAG: type II secretion system inner membrane protein GspF, partial [Candidatus Marinimicrobia bacterium]|nr:type II secretion system inner membrane protein GspF [Candidatus Neomarinimicrobiota bacterium]
DTARHARSLLRDQGLTPVTTKEIGAEGCEKREKYPQQRKSRRSISSADLALLTRQLATLVRSGIPLEESLLVVSEQVGKPLIKGVVMAIRSRILEGHSFAVALAGFPQIFTELYCATVEAGEQAGYLDHVLERLADYTEARQKLQQKIGVALLYPLMISIVAILVVVALLTYVVPQVVQVFESIDQQLPALTTGLIATSEFVQEHGGGIFLAILMVILLFKIAIRREGVRRRYHQLLLKTPLLFRVIRGSNTARFTRTLSILMSSGVPMLEGLKISSRVMTNLPMKEAVEQAAKQVREGASVHSSLDQSKIFPPMMIHLIASGEASGKLDEMLERASIQQEDELESLITGMTGLFEPLMILLMGGIVLTIVIAILLPIFDLNQLVQ